MTSGHFVQKYRAVGMDKVKEPPRAYQSREREER